MPVTINTNSSSYVALANLRNVQGSLAQSQKKISTGFEVSDALDNGAVFGVAQLVRSNITANIAVTQELGNFSGLIQTAAASSTQISNTLSDIRGVLSHLASSALDATSQGQYVAQLRQLTDSISHYISSANYGNTNLLSTTQNFNILADNQPNNNINVTGGNYNISLSFSDLNNLANSSDVAGGGFSGAAGVSIATNAQRYLSSFDSGVLASVSTVLNNVGALNRVISTQIDFNKNVQSALKNALGSLVDADLAAESAQLTALQVKQQLATQALSVANQSPNSLLKLFQ